MPTELQQRVSARALSRCEYFRMHQSLQGATFHVEHVIPRTAGGSNKFENLAWACPSCNLRKSDRTTVVRSNSSQPIPLFNPREHRWSDHFYRDEYEVVGKTEIGQATIDALDLNHERRIKIRQAEQLFELFPPDPD